MGIVIRQSIKTTLVSYVGFGIGYLNTLFLFPLVLTKEQIGLTRLLISVSFLFATLASLGAGNIPTKFFPYFRDEKKQHNGILAFILSIGMAGFISFVIIFLLFRDLIITIYAKNSPLLLNYYFYFIPFTLIVVLTTIFESYLIVQQKPVLPALIREILMRLLIMLGLVSIYFGFFSFNNFADSLVIFYALGLAFLVFYIKQEKILFLKPNAQIFKGQHFKEMVKYAIYIIFYSASATITANIDSLMLSAYIGLGSAGIYTIAFFIAAVIEIPKRSISQVVIPIVAQANKDNDIMRLEEFYKKTSSNQLVIGGLIFLVIWCNIDYIFNIIPNGEMYAQGKWVVFWIGISKLFDMATGVNQEIVGTSKYYKIDLLLFIFLGLLAIATNLLLIPKYGLVGAAVASAVSVFLYNIMRFIFLLIAMNIQPFSLNTLKTIIIIAFVFMVSYYLPQILNYSLIEIIFRSFILSFIYTTAVLFSGVSEDINLVFYKSVKRFFKRS